MKTLLLLFVALLLVLLVGCTAKPAYTPTKLTWDNDIRVVFENNCIECHGKSKTEAGLNLMSTTEIQKNIWTIYKMVVLKEAMPPKNNSANINLSVNDRRDINDWIRGNAPGIGPGTPY